MPFKQYQSTLDPEALRIHQEAFNQTLAEVVALPGTSVDEQLAAISSLSGLSRRLLMMASVTWTD